jgi:hypothetical protein
MKIMRMGMFLCFLCACVHAGDFSVELAKVKSGELKEARAEWWGYNPQDSTESLQAALNSGVRKLIISRQSGPWMVKSMIALPSNMEIVFEDGAEIKAMRGYFKRNVDLMLCARNCSNLTLRGKGIVTMNRADYQDPKQYQRGEHRHTLGVFSSSNIQVKDLLLQLSGGDGIYVNNVRDIVIENVVLDRHHRQGISVINAENLLIKNCVIKNTAGTAPECGIDFEPNYPSERLVNCRVVDSRFENNAMSGINISNSLTAESTPIDIVMEGCVFKGNKYGLSFASLKRSGSLGTGKVTIRNCRIEDSSHASIYLDHVRSCGHLIQMENVTVSQPVSSTAPIYFYLRPTLLDKAGNLNFINCTFDAPKAREVLDRVNMSTVGGGLEKVTGTVIFNGAPVDLAAFIKSKGFDVSPAVILRKVKSEDLVPAGFSALSGKTPAVFKFRGGTDMLLRARANEEVLFSLEYFRMGSYATPPLTLTAVSPDGEKIEVGTLEYAAGGPPQEFRFTPRQSGNYVMNLPGGVNCIAVRTCSVPWTIFARSRSTLANIFASNGTIYFSIPAGVKSFGIEVGGNGASEAVDVELQVDGALLESAQNLSRPRYFTINLDPAEKPRLGSLTLRMRGGVFIILPDPLLPIFSTSPENVFIDSADSRADALKK